MNQPPEGAPDRTLVLVGQRCPGDAQTGQPCQRGLVVRDDRVQWGIDAPAAQVLELIDVVAQLAHRQARVGNRACTAAQPRRVPRAAPLESRQDRRQIAGEAEGCLLHGRDDLIAEPLLAVRLFVQHRQAERCGFLCPAAADQLQHPTSPRLARVGAERGGGSCGGDRCKAHPTSRPLAAKAPCCRRATAY